MKLKIISLIITVSLLFSSCDKISLIFDQIADILPITEKVYEINPIINKEDLYGRSLLTEEEQKVYDKILYAVENMETTTPNFKLTKDDALRILNYLVLDNPQLFWLDLTKGYNYIYDDDDYILNFNFEKSYTCSKEEVELRKAEIDSYVDTFLSDIKDSDLSEYEKEKFIYDKLLTELTYDLEATDCNNIYGAFTGSRVLCEGYAKAFQYLLYKSSISCIPVIGKSDNELHMWNIVKIGGEYYHVDPTFGDYSNEHLKDSYSYDYFNITDADIYVDHFITEDNYPLPQCTTLTYNYFVLNNLVFSDMEYESKKKLGTLFKEFKGPHTLSIKFTDTVCLERAVNILFDKGDVVGIVKEYLPHYTNNDFKYIVIPEQKTIHFLLKLG